MKVSPSLLAADFADLKNEVAKIATADMLHLDVMDGIFVPNISFGAGVIGALRPHTDLFFDVHLMIEEIVYLQDVSFLYDAVTQNTLFQKIHPDHLLIVYVISYYIILYEFCRSLSSG